MTTTMTMTDEQFYQACAPREDKLPHHLSESDDPVRCLPTVQLTA